MNRHLFLDACDHFPHGRHLNETILHAASKIGADGFGGHRIVSVGKQAVGDIGNCWTLHNTTGGPEGNDN